MHNAQSWGGATYIKFKKKTQISPTLATLVSDFLTHCCVAKQSISKSTFMPNFALLTLPSKMGDKEATCPSQNKGRSSALQVKVLHFQYTSKATGRKSRQNFAFLTM